jgi:hypothetical protein
MPSPRDRHCECYVCIHSNYFDNLGDKRQGQLLEPTTWKRHQIRQEKHVAKQDATIELQSVLFNATNETIAEPTSAESLPIRKGDEVLVTGSVCVPPARS